MNMHIDQTPSVFHPGERQMHERLGISERLHGLGLRMIRDHMPDQHREFFRMLRTVHLGILDGDGYPSPILRIGKPGFLQSPSEKTLIVSSSPLMGEPDDLDLSPGAKISVLGLQMETRRRNRMNATIAYADSGHLNLSVDQSYGNCPKYVQVRNLTAETAPSGLPAMQYASLGNQDQAQIAAADTLILASRAPEMTTDPRAGVDINHRGGMPGFVSVLDANTIEFPDYKGNNFYNSFGNILLDNRVGLQFWEFDTGTILNIKGKAELIERGEAIPPLMGRSLRVHISGITRSEGAVPLRYEFSKYSPANPDLSK